MKSEHLIPPFVLLISFSLAFPTVAHAQRQKNRDHNSVVVGTLHSIDPTGNPLEIRLSDNSSIKLQMDQKTKVVYVGLPANVTKQPKVGFGVKATCDQHGLMKSVSFTPPIGQPSSLGEARLTMTEHELFDAIDKDASESISYAEFGKYIYYSPKHGPDTFRKADQNSNGSLDEGEFTQALSKVSWWNLSRKTPTEWFKQADKNKDAKLNIDEFSSICTSGNHLENIFKRADQDHSGTLTQRETTTYIRSVTHDEKKSRKKSE